MSLDRLKAALFAHCERCGHRLDGRFLTFDSIRRGGPRRWSMRCPNIPTCGEVARFKTHGQYRLARFRSWLYWTFPFFDYLPESWREWLFVGVCFDCREEIRQGVCGCPEGRTIDPDLEKVL